MPTPVKGVEADGVRLERIEIARQGIEWAEGVRDCPWHEPPSFYSLAKAAVDALSETFRVCECGHIRNHHGNGIVSTACRPSCGCAEWHGVEYLETPPRADDLRKLIEVFDRWHETSLAVDPAFAAARDRIAAAIDYAAQLQDKAEPIEEESSDGE